MTYVRHYDYKALERECELTPGMKWDQGLEAFIDPKFHAAGLTQNQVEAAVRTFIEIQLWQWSPRNHTVVGRLKVAFMFLFGQWGKSGK